MKVILYIGLTVLFASCGNMPTLDLAAYQKDWVRENCNVDAAYSKGVEDAQDKEKHSSSTFGQCDSSVRLKASYSRGYTSVTNNPVRIFSDSLESNNRFYKCELKAFNDTYRSASENLGKAKYEVIEKCKSDNNEMHCGDPKCSQL